MATPLEGENEMGKVMQGVVLALAIAGFTSFVMTDLGAGPKLRLGGVLGAGLGTLMILSRKSAR